MAAPLFILAPGRSFTSLVSTMVGQHPHAYGLPELHLNAADTMQDWWSMFGSGSSFYCHGLLRTVAELHFRAQTPQTIVAAWNWIRERLQWTTTKMYAELARSIAPRMIVEKSPGLVNRTENLERLLRFFPDAHFIHLTRHPRSMCKSVLNTDWVRRILDSGVVNVYDHSTTPPTLDPQIIWYEAHTVIREFVEKLPPSQRRTVQGEAFLTDPDRHLKDVASWLGLATDDSSVSEMKHPERSPFARFGPYNALTGNDPGFLKEPALRPFRAKPESLKGPLEWRGDGRGFLPEVEDLARELGYT